MIVVAGESLIDLIVDPAGRVEAVPGGGPFNTARALGRLGRPTSFLGRLSTDRFGRLLRARLEADGVDLRLARETDDPSTLAVAELDERGAATYHFYADGTSAPGLRPEDVPDGLPAGTAAFHAGTLGLVLEPIAFTIETLVAGVADDVLVMIDPNVRPAVIRDPDAYRARLRRVLARADVIKVSTDDLAWLHPGVAIVAAVRQLLADGPRAILVTDGGRPVRVAISGDTILELPVPAVEVVDTVGAGDAFGAGFLAGWIAAGRGRDDLADLNSVREATELAIAVGTRTSQRAGAEPPTLAELGLAAT